jgi:hypothetical protein
MPSLLLSNASGGQNILSGGLWSGAVGGQGNPVDGSVMLRLSPTSPDYCYVSLSGGTTVTSGGVTVSGGQLDGMIMCPGDTLFIPKSALGWSGEPAIYVATGPAGQNTSRLFFEIF